jgi:putative addiction module antidote
MTTLKLTTVGTSTGVVLPKQLLALMRVEKGDQLYAIETPNGVLLTPYDPDIQEQLEAGERLLEKHRDIFKALAK